MSACFNNYEEGFWGVCILCGNITRQTCNTLSNESICEECGLTPAPLTIVELEEIYL